jgi:hypothetical protein
VTFQKADWLFTLQADGQVLVEAPLGSAPGFVLEHNGRKQAMPPGRLLVRLTVEEWRGVIEPVSGSTGPDTAEGDPLEAESSQMGRD